MPNLRSNPDLVAAAFDALPAAAMIADRHGVILWVNTALLASTGYSIEELTGRNVALLGSPACGDSFQATISQVIVSGRPWRGEVECRRKSGEIFAEDRTVAPIGNAAQELTHVLCTSLGASAQQRIDAELEEHEERFQRLVANTDAGYFRIGMDGRYEDVNRAWLQMHGFSGKSEIVGQHYSSVQIPEDWERAAAVVAELVQGRHASSGEFSGLRRDGTVGYHTYSASPVMDGDQVVGIEGFLIDITAHRQAEDSLRRSNERLELAQRAAGAGSWDWDIVAGRMEWSSELFAMFGLDSEKTVASFDAWTSILHPEDREAAKTRVHTALRERALLVNECRIVRPGGQVVWISSLGRGSYDDQGRPLRMDGICIDVTARKHAEQERARLEDLLRQAQRLESIGRLAGGIAHDFNNLLTVINGFAGFLVDGLSAGDPLRKHAERIGKAGETAATLTRQLLAFSRRQMIRPRPLDLNSVVTDAKEMLQRLIGADVELKTVLDPALGRALADPERIRQVLVDLAANARDAMPRGGRLTIETAIADLDDQFAGANPEATPGSFVLLAVTDTGTGMDEQTRQHAFDPFFTTKEVGYGSGLGLASVYGIVHQLGGWISVESELDRGTTFRIYLPRIDTAPGPAPDAGTSAPGLQTGDAVLVVEDHEDVRRFTRTVLTECGFRVLEAGSAAVALNLAATHANQLCLMVADVIMPGLKGRELAAQLQLIYPRMKVLYVSGFTAGLLAERGILDYGMAFLAKPYSAAALEAKVRELLDLPEARPYRDGPA